MEVGLIATSKKGGIAMRRIFVTSVAAALLALVATAPAQPGSQRTRVSGSGPELRPRGVADAAARPIQEFVDAQGTFCVDDGMGGCFLFVPPIENFIGWADPEQLIAASVDYAGLADDFAGGAFGTQFSGIVRERALRDGRAEVRVLLRTHNALTWVVDFSGFDFNGPLLFGNRAPEVLDEGKIPALGQSFLHLTFINTAPGAPLPDLLQLAFAPEAGQELLYLAFNSHADGLFHEMFGVPDGTPGRATVVQQGLFMTGFMGAVGDGFPVERIKLQVVGP